MNKLKAAIKGINDSHVIRILQSNNNEERHEEYKTKRNITESSSEIHSVKTELDMKWKWLM